MPDILVRGLDAAMVKRLKERARRHGRSLQGEVRLVLEQSAGASAGAVERMLGKWRRKFAGRRLSASLSMLREDRRR